jgi:DNA-binding NtrC family response regulator
MIRNHLNLVRAFKRRPLSTGSKGDFILFENRKLLVIEDDRQEIENLGLLLRQQNVNFVLASTVRDAMDAISSDAFDFVLSDLHIDTKAGFEKPDGLFVIRSAAEQLPNVTIVAMSSDPRTEIWNEALSAGAHHFIRKPISKMDEIYIAFSLARERKLLVGKSKKAVAKKPEGRWKKYAEGFPYGIVIGEREMRRARGVAKKRNASCVVIGETGTGKEEIAKLIHRLRSEEEGMIPYVAVNCATITGGIAESLLFGHRKGAFTGAEQSTIGFIGEADGGILFLDEIQTLDIPTQQKLLRVLNDGTYNRVGESKTYRSQFQLIAASTRDLDLEVEAGRFLIDIRTRMIGLDMHLPPLRERIEDIPALTALYLSKKDIEISDKEFSDLVGKLQEFHWSGNIRQLFKALESWILLCEFDELPLTVENFPESRGMLKLASSAVKKTLQGLSKEEKSFLRALNEDYDFEKAIFDFEQAILEAALKRHKSIGECCRALNLPRSTLDAKRRKYGFI